MRGADGSYSLQLQLHPYDLGSVQVHLDVRGGEISIHLLAADGAARDALRGGLSDLRQQLEDQGLRAGSMEVGSGAADTRQRETSWSRSQGSQVSARNLVPSEQLVATAGTASSTALDLRM
jgi:flagellar hook-length control protein FliK